MNTDIIINRLNEIINCMKSFDAKRGTFEYSEKRDDFAATKLFFGDEHKTDFVNAEYMINDKYGAYKIFESGYMKFMSSNELKDFERDDIIAKIISAVRTCDNFLLMQRTDKSFIGLEYFDEKSFFDEEYLTKKDGTPFYYVPDLNDWKTAKFATNEDDIIFYKYSYYIILMAKLLCDTINTSLPITKEKFSEQEISSIKIAEIRNSKDAARKEDVEKIMQKINTWILNSISAYIKDDDILAIATSVKCFLSNDVVSGNHWSLKIKDLKSTDLGTFIWGVWYIWDNYRKTDGGVRRYTQKEFIPLMRNLFGAYLIDKTDKNRALDDKSLENYITEDRGLFIKKSHLEV